MTDKEVENLDEMNPSINISSSSKESEAENVDAIKKYIEEQEILLRLSSSNDLVNQKDKDSPTRVHDNECEILEQLTSNNCQVAVKRGDFKNRTIISSIHSESKHEETATSPLLNPSSSASLLELDSEESLTNQAAVNLLSFSQSCVKMQAEIPTLKTSVGAISEYAKEELCDTLDINQLVDSNTSYTNDTELNSSNISPKTSEDKLHLGMKNELKTENIDNVNNREKSTLKECSLASAVERSSMIIEDVSAQPKVLHKLLTSTNHLSSEVNKSVDLENVMKTVHDNKEHSEETLAIATSVMDMILNDAEAAIKKKKVCGVLSKHCFSPEKANSSVSLAIGSKVEAKDFCELWHPAQIIEVDSEEMEVLVQYDNQLKMHNEWININSPRLRPINSLVTKPISPPRTRTPDVTAELKVEDKQKVNFDVGERCLARWRDNRRFIATVQKDLGKGNYEVMFDDGFQWKCTLSRLYKLKDSGQQEYPQFGARAAPDPAAAPVAAPADPAPASLLRLPLYHTHLFDPTRDYLGSKSERREMKRKLNIKEIFNIGQKRKKISTADKEAKTVVTCIKQEIKCEVSASTPPAETAPAIIPPLKDNSSAFKVKKVITKNPVKKKPHARKKIKLKNIDIKPEVPLLNDVKKEIPEAVASIIGTVCKTEPEIVVVKLEPTTVEIKDSNANDIKPDEQLDQLPTTLDVSEILEKLDTDVAVNEETKLFEIQDGVKHEEVIGKIKEAITKLEDGINKVEKNEIKPEETKEVIAAGNVQPVATSIAPSDKEKPRKSSSKVKKGKKLRLMQEKKVKKQVEKVKGQLEEMKKQVEAMRQEIMLKTEELASSRRGEHPADEGALLPGEWCCRWEDGQPVGAVSEAPAPSGPGAPPRRSVQVEDKRLPQGWTKHMVRRSLGSSAGKWDVVLVSPENRRIHTKNDMRVYLENNPDPALKPFEAALMDFGIHLKLSRRLGWVRGAPPAARLLPAPPQLFKRAKLSLKKNHLKLIHHKKRPKLKIKPLRPMPGFGTSNLEQNSKESNMWPDPCVSEEATLDGASIKDGFVDVGSLRVQVIETLLRCPAEGCFKNFRNTTLLKMHIKHYHRELRKTMGNTPKVLDLAYARTRPTEAEMKRLKREAQQRIIKVKLPRMQKRMEEQVPVEVKVSPPPPQPAASPPPATLVSGAEDAPPKPLDSPKLRNALVNKPPKRPRVLLPVRSKEPEPTTDSETVADDQLPIKLENDNEEIKIEPKQEIPDCVLDFETAISTHTVPKMVNGSRMKGEKRLKTFAVIGKTGASEDEEWAGAGSDPDTRSSYPSCGTPDSKGTDELRVRASSPSDDKDSNHLYMYTENGERIKLVRMKREEIINCHCGFREEDGLMVQCELCLCWQHALCHNIQREAEVPEKYTCSICLNPRRGRRRQRFTHDQDRLYEGLLPGPGGGRACDALRRAHELSGNLLRIDDALHAVRVNTRVAQTKNHPKLYLWARDWESVELSFAQEKLNSEYSDLNVIINNLGKENLPIKEEDINEMALDIKAEVPSGEPEEKHSQRENQMGSQVQLSGLLLSSPGAASIDLPISEFDLEKLTKTVHEHESTRRRVRVRAPQPEAAIENSACRARLLRHIQRCHALLDQRLDSIEAQVAELESQDASLEDDETAAYYPRTKQTVVMVARDLDAMEELGLVT